MASKIIIAICGFKRSGKDTLADHLVAKHGFKKASIATPLKQACKQLFALSDEQVDGDEKDICDVRWGVSPRQILQYFGTEMMQIAIQPLLPGIRRGFWVKRLIHEILNDAANDKWVIPDLRFLHEIDMLKDAFPNITVINVKRPGKNGVLDMHVSETEHEKIMTDATFNNHGSVCDLQSMFDEFYISQT